MARFQINPWFVAGCCVAAFAVPTLAALYPAQRAAHLPVIQALHYE